MSLTPWFRLVGSVGYGQKPGPLDGGHASGRRSRGGRRRPTRIRSVIRPRVQLLEPRALLSTFTVNSTDDNNAGHSLRAAIMFANSNPGTTIEFSIGAPGIEQIITPLSPLPAITAPTTKIDGWSQGGSDYTGSPLIELAGGSAGPNATGLTLGLNSDGSMIDGLVISDFAAFGINVASNDNVIQGNFLGTDLSGSLPHQGNQYGIVVTGSDNTIGGTLATPGAGNLISGNTVHGIQIFGGASNVTVEGNIIGLDATGTHSLGNGDLGIYVFQGGPGIKIGDGTEGAGNVISGNGGTGIVLTGTDGAVVAGNEIGTDLTGTTALGNVAAGININGSSNDTIGGTTTAARNIISGNGFVGVYIENAVKEKDFGVTAGANDNLVDGNYIGIDVSGTVALANIVHGVDVEYDSSDDMNDPTSTSGNAIGGLTDTPGNGAGNVISGNTDLGVYLAPLTADTLIEGNLIGTNASGTGALGNSGDGISVVSPGATIGGTAAGAGNIISGNGAELGFWKPNRHRHRGVVSGRGQPDRHQWERQWRNP